MTDLYKPYIVTSKSKFYNFNIYNSKGAPALETTKFNEYEPFLWRIFSTVHVEDDIDDLLIPTALESTVFQDDWSYEPNFMKIQTSQSTKRNQISVISSTNWSNCIVHNLLIVMPHNISFTNSVCHILLM